MLVNPSEGQDAKSGPKLKKPAHLSLILKNYAQALFYIEASKFPKPHPNLGRWLAKLAGRTREHVIQRLIEVESSRRWHSLGFHGLSLTEARKVIRDAVREMHQKFSPNEGISTMSNEGKYSSLVAKQAMAYEAAGIDITHGSPLLMRAARAGRGSIPDTESAALSSSTPPLNQQIKQLMKDCRLTAEKLAEAIHLDPRNVYRHLAGKTGLRDSTIDAYEKFFSERLGRHVRLNVSKTSVKRR